MRSIKIAVLTVGILSSPSWSNYNGFPVEDPLVTGTFMEYRESTTRQREHFHGGVDLIPRPTSNTNNLVRPVAGGELYYLERPGNTYSFWIDHP